MWNKIVSGCVIYAAVLERSYAQNAASTCALGGGGTTVVNQFNTRCTSDMAITSTATTLETCCGRETDDARLRRILQQETSAPSNSDGACRYIELDAPYCEGNCDDINSADEFTINLSIDSVEEDSSCCQSCTCYGDPECISFDGVRDAWVLCDGRTRRRCIQTEERCLAKSDHKQNQCKWLMQDGEEWDFNNGSPCQPDFEKSGYASMNMYSADSFNMDLELGERGVIVNAIVTTSEGKWKLNADECFNYDPRDSNNPNRAWERLSGSRIPDSWSYSTVENNVEVTWYTADTDAGVFATIVCTRSFANGVPGAARLNIQSISETQPGRPGSSGFCQSGAIDKTGSARIRRIEVNLHQRCSSRNVPSLVSACKSLIDPTCNFWTMEEHLQSWCNSADLSHTMVAGDRSSCIEKIVGKNRMKKRSKRLTKMVCQANQLDTEQCMAEISQFGWETFLQSHSSGIIVENSNVTENLQTCASSVTEYTKSDNSCNRGIRVEYLKDSEWHEAFFIPSDHPPCSGTLKVTGDLYPELFKYRVRLSQCALSGTCLQENSCKPSPGFSASFKFMSTFCPAAAQFCTVCDKEATPPQMLCEDESIESGTNGECEECCNTADLLDGSLPQACRDISAKAPFCSPQSQSEKCDRLEEFNAELKLRVSFAESSSTSCCNQCSCWGDPLCNSFTDVMDKWILCDGRKKGNCKVEKSICDTQLDHNGNQCGWDQSIAQKLDIRRRDIAKYGSPCQPNYALSGRATMLMYKVLGNQQAPEVSISLEMGDRGIITAIDILKDNINTFSLRSDKCQQATKSFPERGFDIYLNGATNPMKNTRNVLDSNSILVDVENGPATDEKTLSISMPDVGLFLQATCIQVKEGKTVYKTRINIPNLIDTNLDRIETDQSGFCVENVINKGSSTTDVTDEVHEECTEGLDDVHLMCKAVHDPSCTVAEVPFSIKEWCLTANVFPGQADRVDRCIAAIDPDNGDSNALFKAWSDVYCNSVSNKRASGQSLVDFHRFCLSKIANEGIANAAKTYGSGSMADSTISTCASSSSEYSKGKAPCDQGVSVETYNPATGLWEVEFFIPAAHPPCDGEMVLSPTDHINMFTREIRYVQCDIDREVCPIDVSCLPFTGLSASFDFTYDQAICAV